MILLSTKIYQFMKRYLFVLLLFFSDLRADWNSRDLVSLYFHNSQWQSQWAWDLFSKCSISGDERILDFGSGDGKITALISRWVQKGSVTGVDISKEMVFFAQSMFSYPNLEFVLLQDTNFSDLISIEKFDLVTAFSVFHLISNPLIVVQNLGYHMKPNAKLVMTVPLESNPEFFRAVEDEMDLRGWDYPPPTTRTLKMNRPDTIADILSIARFEIDYFEVVDTCSVFSSKEKFVDWLEATFTRWNIPSHQRRHFFQALADRYLIYQPDKINNEGFISFPLQRVDVIASSL